MYDCIKYNSARCIDTCLRRQNARATFDVVLLRSTFHMIRILLLATPVFLIKGIIHSMHSARSLCTEYQCNVVSLSQYGLKLVLAARPLRVVPSTIILAMACTPPRPGTHPTPFPHIVENRSLSSPSDLLQPQFITKHTQWRLSLIHI